MSLIIDLQDLSFVLARFDRKLPKKKERNDVYLCVLCILNWPLPIGAFQDQYKQTMINKYSNEHNHVKNPN